MSNPIFMRRFRFHHRGHGGCRNYAEKQEVSRNSFSARVKANARLAPARGFQLFDFPDDPYQGNGVFMLGRCEFVNAARKGLVGGQGFAEPGEGAHDEDVHLHSNDRY
jgi:hypothetical protein